MNQMMGRVGQSGPPGSSRQADMPMATSVIFELASWLFEARSHAYASDPKAGAFSPRALSLRGWHESPAVSPTSPSLISNS
eukprot:scaffold98677_cov39-Tisochrysis_lutea.AAC.1